MKFAGQIRVPEVDHPGVPATFVVDDNQAEVILEGESLGRWSLFDVHVTRLVSSAFQVELAGEEITFLADEPVDFAYKGVEHMAEAWARYKTMTVPRRVVAVKRSRKGTTPSRIEEFRSAMVENLRREQSGTSAALAGEEVSRPKPVPPTLPPVETMPDSPDVIETEDAVMPIVAREDEQIAAERQALAEERALLEEQRRTLEKALEKAESLEKDRLEAAKTDMERIEEEKRALAKRHETERIEAERLKTERLHLEQLEADRVERERQQAEHLAARQQELEKLEAEKLAETKRLEKEAQDLVRREADRVEMERVEAERLEVARLELEKAERERAEAARLEMEKLEKDRLELERLEAERLNREQAETARVEKERLAKEKQEAKRLKKEKAAATAVAASAAAEPEVEPDSEVPGRVAEVLGTSAEGDLPENAKELIVDLGEFGQGEPDKAPQPQTRFEPEAALAGVPEKAGIMGAVRSAFGRSGKNHIHEFTEAPGGIGMVRYICRECGYVSISSSD